MFIEAPYVSTHNGVMAHKHRLCVHSHEMGTRENDTLFRITAAPAQESQRKTEIPAAGFEQTEPKRYEYSSLSPVSKRGDALGDASAGLTLGPAVDAADHCDLDLPLEIRDALLRQATMALRQDRGHPN